MLTSSGYGAISPIGPAKVYQAKTERGKKTKMVQGVTNTTA